MSNPYTYRVIEAYIFRYDSDMIGSIRLSGLQLNIQKEASR